MEGPKLILVEPFVFLRLPTPLDASAIASYQNANRFHFKPFEPTRPDCYFTESFWKVEAQAIEYGFNTGQSMRLFMFRDESVIGSINFLLITRGNFQSCILSYNLDYNFWGRGVMTRSLQMAIQYAFETLKLRRIQANYIPENLRSAKLLERLGFEKEGYAKELLEIDGQWHDHVFTSLLNHKR